MKVPTRLSRDRLSKKVFFSSSFLTHRIQPFSPLLLFSKMLALFLQVITTDREKHKETDSNIVVIA